MTTTKRPVVMIIPPVRIDIRCPVSGIGSQTYIRPIKQDKAPTVHPDGTYTQAEYSLVPTKLEPTQDLYTFKEGKGGRLRRGTGQMRAYTHGGRSGHVHTSFGHGNNIHGAGQDKTVVNWRHFDFGGYPMTEFETMGPGGSVIHVPIDYTGEPQYEGGERTCTGFFIPDTV
jgi:hypothetical protein